MTNRLASEKSPYLLQHAHNPVDWYPWGDAAFTAAREHDRPVFLSIGYATCHWCHVMERESFEDPEVARLMNDTFVNIKVDREERPDIDGIYMTVAQMIAGHGGWPLTIVMLPDGRPFFAATYIPKETRYGRIGMLDLIPRLAEVWRDRRGELTESAASLHAALARHAEGERTGASLGEATLREGYVELAGTFDRELAGFGRAPKFPTPHLLLFLLRYWHRTGADAALAMVRQTLGAMRAGGIYDQIGFGLHRYATDRRWLVPHFEKMLYDQAMFTLACTDAWQAAGDAALGTTVREILTYVRRDLTSPDGLFYSAEDADSEGVEGKFYVWTLDELRAVAGEHADLAAAYWGAEPGGNYDEESTRERTGTNILHVVRPPADVASKHSTTEEDLGAAIGEVRERLLERRSGRVRPLLDDKVLTDWNGLMIAAAARAGWALGDAEAVTMAERAADGLWRTMWHDGVLLHRYRDGDAAITGNLDDYAFFSWGLVELHQATQQVVHLERALLLTDAMLGRFWDDVHGGFFFAPAERTDLLVRLKDLGDGALPSGSAVAMYNLVRLARLTGREAYEARAGALADASARQIAARPSGAGFFLVALDFAVGPSQELVVVGRGDDAATRALLDVAREMFRPRLVVLHRDPGDDAGLVEIVPAVGAFRELDGKPAAYLCQDFACERPVRSPDDLRMLLSRLPG